MKTISRIRTALLRNKPGWTYLLPYSRTTQQEKWSDQIALDRSVAKRERRQADLLDWLGFHRTAARIRYDAVCLIVMAHRMEACPNNPRNGGDGFDSGDGTWTDRRVGEMEYL